MQHVGACSSCPGEIVHPLELYSRVFCRSAHKILVKALRSVARCTRSVGKSSFRSLLAVGVTKNNKTNKPIEDSQIITCSMSFCDHNLQETMIAKHSFQVEAGIPIEFVARVSCRSRSKLASMCCDRLCFAALQKSLTKTQGT